MRDISTDFARHLRGEATALCHCLSLHPVQGTPLYLTDHDVPLEFKGKTYLANAGLVSSSAEENAELIRDGLEVQTILSSVHLSKSDLLNGVYDGATYRFWRVNWSHTDNAILLSSGVLGAIKMTGDKVHVNLEGPSLEMQKRSGRVFQPRCDARLGDTKCRVDVTNSRFHTTTTLVKYETGRLILPVLSAFDKAWFAHGRVEFLDGKLSGVRARIRSDETLHQARQITLWDSLVGAPSSGDGVKLVAGCDKSLNACAEKFSNSINFRGMPHMPADHLLVRAI